MVDILAMADNDDDEVKRDVCTPLTQLMYSAIQQPDREMLGSMLCT